LGPLLDSPAGNGCHGPLHKVGRSIPYPQSGSYNSCSQIGERDVSVILPPQQLHSDQDRQFDFTLLAEICKCLHINKTSTTQYHPQGDALCSALTRLYSTCWQQPQQPTLPCRRITFRKWCWHTTRVHPTTGYTPFYLMFGHEAYFPVDLIYGSSPDSPSSPSQYAAQLTSSLPEAYACTRTRMQTEHRLPKECYDKR